MRRSARKSDKANQEFNEILNKNRLINRQGPYRPPSSSSSDDASVSSDEYIIQSDDDVINEEDNMIQSEEEIQQQESVPLTDPLPPVVVTPNASIFWGCVLGLMILGILVNLGCIYLVVTSSSRNEDANHLIDLINENVANSSLNIDSDCMTCSYGLTPDETTTLINAIMHTNSDSELLTQFSQNGGITLDNINLPISYPSSSNVNTSILFENNLEASNMLISATPGLISIPLETSSQLTTLGTCPSSNNIVPSIYAYKQISVSSTTYYICFCESTNKYCQSLIETVV